MGNELEHSCGQEAPEPDDLDKKCLRKFYDEHIDTIRYVLPTACHIVPKNGSELRPVAAQ